MSTLCFIDCESTGLDARIHQPYEVCWWREEEEKPQNWFLPHTLEHADQQALRVGNYWERYAHNALPGGTYSTASPRWLALALEGVTLVGSNPAFDAAMLTRFIGAPVWHHRMIDVANVAMVVFDLDRPEGLAATASRLVEQGYRIPGPDHTAEGDVRTTRAVYEALRDMRSRL